MRTVGGLYLQATHQFLPWSDSPPRLRRAERDAALLDIAALLLLQLALDANYQAVKATTYLWRLGEGGQIRDEGERRLETRQPRIRREQFAALLLSESDIEAVVYAHAQLRRNLHGTAKERQVGKEFGTGAQHVGQEHGALRGSDATLTFGTSQRVGDLNGENVGGKQLMNLLAIIVADTLRLVGVGFCHNPLESDGGIEDVFH
jgi:hypothetical protein